MEEKKEEIIPKKRAIGTSVKEVPTIDNNTLSMDELIVRIGLLSKNNNPYTVSKEIEEIKSIFYIKLNLEKEEEITPEETEEQEEKAQKELHPLEVKFKAVFDAYRKIKSDFRKNQAKEEEKNLKIKRQIIEDIDTLAKEEESIKTTFEKFRTLQKKWKDTGYVPITENNHLWQSYHHHVELFYDFIKLNYDLRDLDFKRNLEEKTAICEKATRLLKEKSITKAHDSLQELHEHWKNVGPVEREQREPLWEKFQEISRKINKKRNDYFIEKKKQDSRKLELKNAICAKINNLTSEKNASHKQWQTATSQCNELESKWKSISGLNKKSNKIAWKKLRDSLTNFYNTRKAFYKEQKEKSKQILENKLAICEKAENLQNSTDWQGTGKKFIKLQEEWKNSEFSPANQSNKIWKRFKTACDTFFKARKAHYKKIEKEEGKAYKEKEEVIKEIEGFTTSSDSKKDISTLKAFNTKWKNIGHIPRNKMDINDRFFNILNAKFEELGLSKKALVAEQYKTKVSSLKGNSKAINIEQQSIMKKIETLKKEITQYENNMSFFGSDKATEPLLQQAQKQIDNAKANIEDLNKKIQLLNKA
ncbi:MAG: DUF349 domain-containing protein [Bacteroidota bacterium]|nr:DUF349 domain-containing protein [Bacteroidota bacterium]